MSPTNEKFFLVFLNVELDDDNGMVLDARLMASTGPLAGKNQMLSNFISEEIKSKFDIGPRHGGTTNLLEIYFQNTEQEFSNLTRHFNSSVDLRIQFAEEMVKEIGTTSTAKEK